MINNTPSTTAIIGRDSSGRFGPGNAYSRGHRTPSRIQELRSKILTSISTDDVAAIVAELVRSAKSGDTKAAKLILDLIGTPTASDIIAISQPMTIEERKAAILDRLQKIRTGNPEPPTT